MIFYKFTNDKNIILKQCTQINNELQFFSGLQINKQKELLKCVNISIALSEKISTLNEFDIPLLGSLNLLNTMYTSSNMIFSNTQPVLENLSKLMQNISNSQSLDSKIYKDIDEFNELYNSWLLERNTYILKNDNFSLDFLDDFYKLIQNFDITHKKQNISTNNDINTEEISADDTNEDKLSDNTLLLISERERKIFLPYHKQDIQNIFNKNKDKYNSLQDVIDDKFVIPISKIRNPIFSRFREAFRLMKNKEHATFSESFDLAIELAFNSLLNPAVIMACRNLDELDIYLDYLDSNEVEKFDIFKVKYDVPPLSI